MHILVNLEYMIGLPERLGQGLLSQECSLSGTRSASLPSECSKVQRALREQPHCSGNISYT